MCGKKKVLIYFTTFDASLGGSEYLPLECVASFQDTCEVTLALNWTSDVRHAAELYGIPVDFTNVRIVTLKPRNRFLQRLDSIIPFCTVRNLKRLARKHDLCISCANMIDFGKPGFHFIFLMRHFGDQAFIARFLHLPAPRGLAAFKKALRKFLGEYVLRPLLGVRSPRAMLRDRREWFFPNSNYVAKTMRDFYGPFNERLFYPPTVFECDRLASNREALKVVYVGRIKDEKKIKELIRIVELARARSSFDFRLEIAGALFEDRYVADIRDLAGSRPWLSLVGEVYGDRKSLFLTSGTYAVHTRRDEEFGIAVAEYLKAGVIPIVPDEGGSPEVVSNSELVYHDEVGAAEILVRLAGDSELRNRIREQCLARSRRFSLESYRKSYSDIISWLEEKAGLTESSPSEQKEGFGV